jgi:thiol:disulfide interchange protein DsbD
MPERTHRRSIVAGAWVAIALAASAAVVSFAIFDRSHQARADDAKPKKKDSPPFLKPKEVTWTTSISPAQAKPGDKVTYKVSASVLPPWHIYAHAKSQPEMGPRNTQFDLFDSAGLKVDGDWIPSKPPLSKPEPAFNNQTVEFYDDDVTWSIALTIPIGTKPGKLTVRSQAYFQICDPKSCKPPVFVTVPDATVTVTSGGAAGGSAALVLPMTIGTVVLPGATQAQAPAKPAAGTVEASIDQGLFSFLLFSAAGGLLAILMPCVWPMIPITVNFFVKQGHSNKGRATGLAIVYCLAIMSIFTSVGLAVTFARGATGATELGNNPWLNLIMGIAFIALGLSLLGLFEIRLPTALLNKSAQGEGKGGLIGVMFMALTLTITSFTCTAPVVGGLLGLATKGQVFYPVLGMLTFSAVLALPFFVVALVPSLMSRLPRSGDWMNAVKVVGALIEIGAAFKFLNTAEISFGTTPDRAWIDARVVLTAWVVMSLVGGIYLLGLFRTDHDHDAVRVGPLRLMFGALFVGAAFYLAPALFGNPPKSRFYEQIVGILPADSRKLDQAEATTLATVERLLSAFPAPGVGVAAGDARSLADQRGKLLPNKATSTDPQQAIREERRLHGVIWGMSYEDAIAEAKATGKLVLIDFTGVNCANCRTVEQSIMPRPEVVAELKKFVTVQLYTDRVDIDSITADQQLELAIANASRENDMTGGVTSPFYVVVSPDEKVLARTGYEANSDFLLKFLKDAQGKHPGGQKVANAG